MCISCVNSCFAGCRHTFSPFHISQTVSENYRPDPALCVLKVLKLKGLEYFEARSERELRTLSMAARGHCHLNINTRTRLDFGHEHMTLAKLAPRRFCFLYLIHIQRLDCFVRVEEGPKKSAQLTF